MRPPPGLGQMPANDLTDRQNEEVIAKDELGHRIRAGVDVIIADLTREMKKKDQIIASLTREKLAHSGSTRTYSDRTANCLGELDTETQDAHSDLVVGGKPVERVSGRC